jgi:hypothetical protein
MQKFKVTQGRLAEARKNEEKERVIVLATQQKLDVMKKTLASLQAEIEQTSQRLREEKEGVQRAATVVLEEEKNLAKARGDLDEIGKTEVDQATLSLEMIAKIILENPKKSFWRVPQLRPGLLLARNMCLQSFVDRTKKLYVVIEDGDEICYVPETPTSYAIKCKSVNGNYVVVYIPHDPEWHGNW